MARFNMNKVDADSYYDALDATDGADVFLFSPGHGVDRIHRFNPWVDKIDLTGFGQNIPWEELNDCLIWQTRGDPDKYGSIVTGFWLDLSKWGGGVIQVSMDRVIDHRFDQFKHIFKLPVLPVDIDAGAGDDTLTGSDDDDVIDGNEGDDTIVGYDGDDALVGGAGDDNIDGGAGDDQIAGQAGDDRIRTGAGNDTIYFARGGGNDTIVDFNDSNDRISITNLADITGFSDISAHQDGDNVVIDFSEHGGGSITLMNFDLDDLDANNFIFAEDADG